MKKNWLYKILLISIISFCFITHAKAGLSCDTKIEMKGIVSGGFDVRVAYCEFTFNGNFSEVASASHYADAVAKKDSYTYSQKASTSSKIGTGGPVPLCNYKGHGFKVIASTTCTCTKTVVEDTCDYTYTCEKDAEDPKPVVPKPGVPQPLDQAPDVTPMAGCAEGYHSVKSSTCTQYYVCPEGYTGSERTTNSSATCTKNYEFSQEVTTEVTTRALQTFCSGKGTCTCDPVSYGLNCPVFECRREEKVNGACYEKFQISSGPTAYCVNPAEHYPSSASNNYQYDYTFDVQKCSSSHSTVDCGYANVLIEASYNNKKHSLGITEGAISLALRLWGAHSKVSGFGNVGLANTEGNCSSLMIYHDSMPNVYKVSVGYITDYLFNKVTKYVEDHKNSVYNLLMASDSPIGGGFKYIDGEGTEHTYINCDRIGLVCGIGDNYANKSYVYRSAFALYFNTLIGNSEMLSHLRYIYGGGEDTTPTGASLVETVVGEGEETTIYSRVEVLFDEEDKTTPIAEDVIVDCDRVLNDPSYEYYKNKYYGERIAPYCKVKVSIIDSDGNVIYDKLKLQECNLKTFGCYSKKIRFAICDFVERYHRTPSIVVHYEKTTKSYSVRKYIACGTTEKTTPYQIMFAFYNKTSTSPMDDEKDPGKTTFDIIPTCRNDDYCTDLNVRKSAPRCENSKADETTYGKIFTGYVKDPPLNCLLNSRGSAEYDYSEVFGVNTDVCRIYCSDSVEYILADKIRAKSGTSVKFNIEFQATKMKQSNELLTAVIRERRTCVSKIFVGSNKFDAGYDWEKQYGITREEINSVLSKNYIENVEDLLKILIKKSGEENNRQENINKLIFDLYNCNLYPKNKIIENTNVSNSKKVKYVVEEIYNTFSVSNNFGLSGCTIYDSNGNYKNDCVVMGETTYEGAAEIGTADRDGLVYDTGTTVGNNPGIKMSSYATKDSSKDYENTIRFYVSKTKYCTDPECVRYNTTEPSKPYYKEDNYDILNSKYFSTTSTMGTIQGYSVPVNLFAAFEITTDFGFYNSERFQVYPNNGYVKNVTNGGASSALLTLDKNTYPSSKVAYNKCSIKNVQNSDGSIDKTFNRCEVTYNINSIHTYTRNYKSNNFMIEVNNMNRFNCYIDFEPPQTCLVDDCKSPNGFKDNTLYRNIDTSKMFNNEPETDSNWASSDGLIAIGMIESSSEDLKVTDDYLEYRITLSPTQIKAIKSDINRNNTDNNSYIDERVYGCSVVDDTYRDCKSFFLDELRKESVEVGGGTYGTIDPNYKTGESKKSKEAKIIENQNRKGQ